MSRSCYCRRPQCGECENYFEADEYYEGLNQCFSLGLIPEGDNVQAWAILEKNPKPPVKIERNELLTCPYCDGYLIGKHRDYCKRS